MMYIHPTTQYLNFFLAVAMIWFISFKEALKFLVISTTVLFITISPWIIRNYNLYKKFIPSPDVMYQGIWEGWGEFEDNPMGAILSDEETFEQIKREDGFTGEYGTREYNELLKIRVEKAIKEHPTWVVTAVFRRIPSVMLPQFNWRIGNFDQNFVEVYLPVKASPNVKNILDLIYKFPVQVSQLIINKFMPYIIFILSMIGIYLSRKNGVHLCFFTRYLSTFTQYCFHFTLRHAILCQACGFSFYFQALA